MQSVLRRIAGLVLLLGLAAGAVPAGADVPPAPDQPRPPDTVVYGGPVTEINENGFEIGSTNFVWTLEPAAGFGLAVGDQVKVTAHRGGARYFADTIHVVRPDGTFVQILPAGQRP